MVVIFSLDLSALNLQCLELRILLAKVVPDVHTEPQGLVLVLQRMAGTAPTIHAFLSWGLELEVFHLHAKHRTTSFL